MVRIFESTPGGARGAQLSSDILWLHTKGRTDGQNSILSVEKHEYSKNIYNMYINNVHIHILYIFFYIVHNIYIMYMCILYIFFNSLFLDA